MAWPIDTQTRDRHDIIAYRAPLDNAVVAVVAVVAVAAIVARFARKKAATLLTGRGGKLLDATTAVENINDFTLVAGLMLK